MMYEQIFNLVKPEIDNVTANLCRKLRLEDPILTQVKDFLNAPAKRIRPLIAILYLKAAGKTLSTDNYKLLTAIELVHNASLIHDDVIDNAELRRNKKTLNSLYNSKLAVITGDYLLSCALEYIHEINNSIIIEKFAQTLADMCKGEFTQYFCLNKIPTLENYLLKTEQKTAKLFITTIECSLQLTNSCTQHAIDFAKNFGIAFQIKDDLNNILTSKSDITNGIYTAPVILSGSIDTPAIEKTYSLLNNYVDNALKNLNVLEENKYKKALQELTESYRK